MRLVPEMGNFTDPSTAAKCKELWARQCAFMAHMKTASSWEIASLDYPGSHGQTLRALTMKLFKSKVDPSSPLFHSIDRRDLRGPTKF
ncbi:hypothetical protein ACA910_001345 [Epithemia clementina (nom. ined.)]